MRLHISLVALAAFVLTGTGLANDSVGHLSAGGIVLGRSDDIEMRSEDLYVSTAEVRVHYRFFNTSDKDITALVAFPMPDVAAPNDADNRAIPIDTDPVNFMGFKTQVGGKPADMKVEQRVIAVGIDRTELLKSLNVPLAPYTEAARKAVDALPAERKEELVALGVARAETYDQGKGMQRHVLPNWTLRTTYYWTQVFPAKKELVIQHQYKPSVGASVGTMVGSDTPDAATMADYRRRYCMDAEFVSAATRVQKALARKQGAMLGERRLEYVLVTGANWAGPIKDFRLVVDKGSPDNLVSLCGEKIKKISATQFEMRATDFFPQRNLEVLILQSNQ